MIQTLSHRAQISAADYYKDYVSLAVTEVACAACPNT